MAFKALRRVFKLKRGAAKKKGEHRSEDTSPLIASHNHLYKHRVSRSRTGWLESLVNAQTATVWLSYPWHASGNELLMHFCWNALGFWFIRVKISGFYFVCVLGKFMGNVFFSPSKWHSRIFLENVSRLFFFCGDSKYAKQKPKESKNSYKIKRLL